MFVVVEILNAKKKKTKRRSECKSQFLWCYSVVIIGVGDGGSIHYISEVKMSKECILVLHMVGWKKYHQW